MSPEPDASIPSSPPEKANTAGTIISPDKNATPVSKISICRTDVSRLVFRSIYEPYVTMIPIISDME